MIQRAYITAWRKVIPWDSDAQVEQDLVISRALVEIFSDPLLSRELVFRGGTAIHKLLISPPGRYSEDIDLVQGKSGPIGPVLDALRSRLDPWLGEPKRKRGEGRVTLIYRFDSEIAPVVPLRLKVEINTREHFSVLGTIRKRFAVANPWFSGEAEVLTYTLDELLGTKMRALYQRKKGRDLFDLATVFEKGVIDPAAVVRCFGAYVERSGLTISRAEFEENLAGKMGDIAFIRDVPPLLAPGVDHDVGVAFERVQRGFICLLPGEGWKGVA